MKTTARIQITGLIPWVSFINDHVADPAAVLEAAAVAKAGRSAPRRLNRAKDGGAGRPRGSTTDNPKSWKTHVHEVDFNQDNDCYYIVPAHQEHAGSIITYTRNNPPTYKHSSRESIDVRDKCINGPGYRFLGYARSGGAIAWYALRQEEV